MTAAVVKTRDESYDFIKGILIFLVVWGHAIQFADGADCWNNPIYVWIYSFHMPMFFVISGHFAKKSLESNFFSCVKSKTKRLLVPALFWTSVAIVLAVFVRHEHAYWHVLLNSVHNMWFLYCLWGTFVLGNIVWHFKHKLFMSLFLAVFFITVYPFHSVDIFKGIQFTRQWPEFLIGVFLLPYVNFYMTGWKRIHFIWIPLVVLYLIWFYLAGIQNDSAWMFSSDNYLIRIFVQIVSTIIFFNIFYILSKYINEKIKRCFCYLGSLSMGIYVLHGCFMKLYVDFVGNVPVNVFVSFALSILVCALCVGAVLLIRRVKFLKMVVLGE